MSVLKLSKNDIIRKDDKEDKIKLKRSDLSFDSARVSTWEQTNKQSLDILNDYNNKINNSEWLSEDDRAKYRSALDSYIETANLLRGINKTFGEGYSDEDEKSWLESIAFMNEAYDSTNKYYSQWRNEASFKGESDWFQSSELFDDGYQFGDVLGTIAGSATDIGEHLGAGLIGIGEAALDALITLGPYFAQGQYYSNGGGYNLHADKIFDQSIKASKDWASDFVEKDLYDEGLVAKTIIADPVKALTGIDAATDSVFGEKTDNLAQSAGQLAGTAILQSVGVPWWMTTGATALGGEAESALNQGATLDEAALSGIFSAGAEILTEKISSGISFGGKTLDDFLPSLTSKISNKVVRKLADLGIDMVGEGAEEILSGYMSAIGQKLTYASDAEIIELFSSEDALDSFIGGAILGAGGSVIGNMQERKQSNKQASEIYGSGTELVAEALDIDPNNAFAQKMQAKLDKGKSLSGGQINRLVEANEKALVSQDKGKIKAVAEAQLTKLGEKGNVSEIAEAIAKHHSGEKLTKAEQALIASSTYGRRVSNGLNPDNIMSGEYDSAWAEGIGTERINPEAYNRSLPNSSEVYTGQAEMASATVNAPAIKNATGAKFEASEGVVNQPVAMESSYKTSEDGKTRIGDLEVSIKEVASVKNGEVTLRLEDGSTVSASDVEFSSSDEGLLYENVAHMGLNAATANAFINNYDGTIPVAEYAIDFRQAYRYGELGIPSSVMSSSGYTSSLSEAQKSLAYDLGKTDAKYRVSEKQAKIDSEKAKVTGKASKKGKVYFDGSAAGKALTERQRASLKGLKVVAEAMGVDIHIFESPVGKDGKRQGENGRYDPVEKVIYLDLHAGIDGNGLMLFTASHELTHHIREVAPTKFKAFADALLEEYTKNGKSVEALITEKLEHLERNGRLEGKTEAGAYDLAYEEVVADAAESMLVDSDAIEALSKKLQAKDKGLWETIKDFIAKLVARIKEAYKGLDPDSAEGQLVREMKDSAERLQKLWVDALLEASEVSFTEGKGEAKYSYSSIAYSFFGDKAISIKDLENRSYKETEGYKRYVEQCLNNMRQSVDGFSEKAALKEIRDSIDGIVEVAVAMKKAGYDILDSEGGRNIRDSKKRLLFSSLEPNSDYFTSSDISTICDKRINFAEIYDEIVRREDAMGVPKSKRFFNNIDNYFVLHKILADKGLTAPCRQCYVESMRKNLDPMANAFIELMQEKNPDNKANKQLYQPSGKNKGELKSNNAKLRENLLEIIEREQYDITADDLTIKMLTTADGLAQLKLQAPLIYEAFNSFYGQSKPKMPKEATPFRFGELTALLTDDKGRIKTGLIKQIKSTGGFRLQSYSDFQIQNFADVLQVIFEAGTLGLNGHAYTKVPAFLDATKGTNLKRNISIFMYKDGGQWKIDRGDSFPYELEKIYDIVNADESGNTGIIAVVQNEDMAAWIMANDNVGYFIPFHKSGVKMGVVRETIVREGGREIKGYSGIKDHTRQQTEVWAKATADHKALTKVKKGINIYEDGLWDFDNAENLSQKELIRKNVMAYIDACNEAGYLPKFREYVMNNGKVLNSVLNYAKQLGFVSQNATIDDISFEYSGYRIPYGYYKCLLDFGMFTPDGEASPIERLSLKDYNFGEAVKFFSDAETLRRNEILQQFENGFEREKYRNSDMTTAQLAEEVQNRRNKVVEEVISGEYKKAKYSDRNSQKVSYAPTFYSHMGKVIDDIRIEKMGAGGVVSYLTGRGVKAEEIKWSGIETFLEGKKSVTKRDLQEFTAGSQLRIVEQVSGDDIDLRYDGSKRAYNLYDTNGKVIDTFTYSPFLDGYVADSDEEIYSNAYELEEALRDAYGVAAAPKWADYKLNGGSNYRELVFQLPNSTYSNRAMRVHWGEDAEGVLAHARIQDFIVNGKKMLFVEEIQSDWHNEGAKDGYVDRKEEARIEKLKAKAEEAFFKVEDYSTEVTGMAGEWDTIEQTEKGAKLIREYDDAQVAYNNAMNALVKKIPDAPFRDTYHEYVLKRLLRMAAEEGYDSIGWTPADIQSKRWSEEFAEAYRIEYDQNIPKFLRKYGKKWGATVGKTTLKNTGVMPEDIQEMIDDLERDIEQSQMQMEELDEDNDYRLFLQDGISDMRATIERARKPYIGDTVWTMDISDSMKESVLYEGQVFYSDRVTDKKTLDFLENQEHVTVYRAMQVIDGELYPPMNAYTKDETGKKVLMTPSKIGAWEQAVERPDLIDPKTGKFKLDKGKVDGGKKGTIIPAAYNPYFHTSASPLNDQFSSAYKRSNLVVVEGEIPASELTSGYRAEFAKDTVGETKWHSGPVAGKLKGDKARRVFLSRWFKPVRIVPDSEVASIVAKTLEGENIEVPYNVVTPSLRAELEKTGVSIQYQDRNTDSYSNRSLLAGALETTTQNDIEREKLQQYKQKIDLINAEEQKLRSLREQIKELSFKKGPRDAKAIKKLQFEANQAANRINTYDKQLLSLESTKALKGVLEREKALARKRDAKKYKEAIEKYREKSANTQRELMDRYQESRKRGVENRNKTAMRHKIKDVVNELNQYLLKGTKDKHVPIELQKAVAEALYAVNMDTVGAEERIAGKRAEMLKAKTPEAIEKLAKEIETIQEMGGNMAKKIARLKTAYDSIINSDDPLVANSHDEVISNTIQRVGEIVGETPLRDMSLHQLEEVYDMYRMVLFTIRNANKAFKAKKSEEISVIANRVMEEIDGLGKKKALQTKVGQFVSSLDWNNQKPVYAFARIGSDSFTEVFNNVRAGEDTWARDMTEAQEFLENQKKQHKYSSWDLDKKYSFTSSSGMKFELTVPQIMSLYAYSKRDQAAEHLKRGGIVFDETTKVTVKTKLGIPIEFNPTEATAYNISEETLADIISKLSAEQKAFVDEMQEYLSTTMGEKGNEVSLELYGIKLFKEKNYFPLKSATQFMAKAKDQQKGEVKIKNSGFSKETVYKANNPIVLTPFMDVWAGHVNEMSMYHAFVLALEDFYRVYNYKTPTSETMATESVEMFLQNAHGKAATKYIDQLLKDLNGGTRSDPTVDPINIAMGRFKKSAVFASASVVVQQPSAIARAMALVDAKYFVGKPSKHKATWAEVKKYAPVAVIKEMGYFDTGMGKSSVEWLKGDKTFMDTVDDLASKAPALADEYAWCAIWNAVKRETFHNNPKLKPNSDEFLKLVGERFTEVVTKTQVYDSVLSRSANMRSKDTGMKMATAFMGEPTTSLNMLQDALIQGKRGNKKYAAKAIGGVISSMILNSILVSIVYAGRDDDEEKTYPEKYINTLTEELLDSFNPLTLIPFIKDIYSITQGYSVERSDMAVITDLINAWNNLDSDKRSVYRKIEDFGGAIAAIFGLPVKNIMRDIRGMYNTINSFIKKDK